MAVVTEIPSLDAIICDAVRTALRTADGNQTMAARMLRITRYRLARLLKKFNLDAKGYPKVGR